MVDVMFEIPSKSETKVKVSRKFANTQIEKMGIKRLKAS